MVRNSTKKLKILFNQYYEEGYKSLRFTKFVKNKTTDDPKFMEWLFDVPEFSFPLSIHQKKDLRIFRSKSCRYNMFMKLIDIDRKPIIYDPKSLFHDLFTSIRGYFAE